MSDSSYRLLWCAAALCFLNFIAFMAIAIGLGGDAVNGKAVEGHFYLGSHGHFREVSEAIFEYSKLHVSSLFITHPLGMLLGLIAGIEFMKRNKIAF
jgi:hypothetical protein